MLVPSSSHHSGNNWPQAGFEKVKITSENRNKEQPTRKAKRLRGCKRSEGDLGEDRLKINMDGPAAFAHREGFNHISLVTVLKPQVLFCTPHFQTLQSRQALGAAYFLLAGCCFEELRHTDEAHATGLGALCLACVCMCDVTPALDPDTSWTQMEHYSGDVPLPNPSNASGQSQSRMWFASMGPTLVLCTSTAKLLLTFIFVVP